jgi:alcohol dehydrogenase class IV
MLNPKRAAYDAAVARVAVLDAEVAAKMPPTPGGLDGLDAWLDALDDAEEAVGMRAATAAVDVAANELIDQIIAAGPAPAPSEMDALREVVARSIGYGFTIEVFPPMKAVGEA